MAWPRTKSWPHGNRRGRLRCSPSYSAMARDGHMPNKPRNVRRWIRRRYVKQCATQCQNRRALTFCFFLCLPQHVQTPRSPNPVRRPSGGAVERGVWHGCQTRNDGPGMAHRDDPRSSAGAREVERSETRMSGALSLWLLSLSREQRESNSP